MKLEDLRSLERQRMYTIFAPLDADERLPRELLLESRRHRTAGRRELAGMLWLPALALVFYVASWTQMNAIVTLGVMVLTLAGFVVFAISGTRDSNLK